MKVNLKEIQDRDDLVVARILAGDYDKLAELKKKLPKDLIKTEEDPVLNIKMDADSNGGEWDYEEVKLLKYIYIYLYKEHQYSTNTM